MSSEKFETINRFIAAARMLREKILASGEDLKSGVSQQAVLRSLVTLQLEVVRAAQAVAAAPHDPEAERIAGTVLLGRIKTAVDVKTAEEWEAGATAALAAIEEENNPVFSAWVESSKPLVELGHEAIERAAQQSHETMIEGFRRAAEQTPGMSLQITEIVGDTLVHDETVLGPEPGQEGSGNHKVGRVPLSLTAVFGLDDDRMETDISQMLGRQLQMVLHRNDLPDHSGHEDVRLTIAERVAVKMRNEFEIVGVAGDLPSPIAGLGAQHFPALRGQLMLQHNIPLIEGPTYSRARRGDRSAQGVMAQFIVLSDMISRAEPYFLPLDQVQTPVRDEELRPLPEDQAFLVWHDTALPIAQGVEMLAWLFVTDEHGSLNPVAHGIKHVDGALETSWCSLRQGQVAPIANQITRALRRGDWETARPVRLPKPSGGRAWKKALVRSSARVKDGGLHGLRTLPR